jgi:hypothetical protein
MTSYFTYTQKNRTIWNFLEETGRTSYMNLSEELLAAIRCCELKLHCSNIRIWQNNSDGISLSGHGIIQQNKFGNLYVEFVRTNTKYELKGGKFKSLVMQFPDDSFDQSQIIYAEFELLNGDIFTSEGFSLQLNLMFRNSHQVMLIRLPLIKLTEPRKSSDHSKCYLYYEIGEKADIPANKMNQIKSTKGFESSSRNETEIVIDSAQINIFKEKKHTEVRVRGNFEVNNIVDNINFYLGVSCGINPQPYLQIINVGKESHTIIKSIDNQKSNQTLLNLIPSNLAVDGKANGEHSYQLLKNIAILNKLEPKRFLSLYSQWERVWYGFTSVNEISELVLTVAIEGLLNDIFIPVFKKTRIDEQLTEEIKVINENISKLPISPEHISRLSGSVSYWKNITAKKALDILEEENVITSEDKKVWEKLRNRCAHPTIKVSNSAEEQKRRDAVLSCLDLLNKLVLNIIGYSGAVNLINPKVNKVDPVHVIIHKDVLIAK